MDGGDCPKKASVLSGSRDAAIRRKARRVSLSGAVLSTSKEARRSLSSRSWACRSRRKETRLESLAEGVS